MRTPFLGGSTVARSRNLADNQLINLYPEIVETKDGKDVGALYATPGLKGLDTVGSGPIRGSINARGDLIVVSGNKVYGLAQDNTHTLLGSINTFSGPVSLIYNDLDQVAIFDGDQGYVFQGPVPLGGTPFVTTCDCEESESVPQPGPGGACTPFVGGANILFDSFTGAGGVLDNLYANIGGTWVNQGPADTDHQFVKTSSGIRSAETNPGAQSRPNYINSVSTPTPVAGTGIAFSFDLVFPAESVGADQYVIFGLNEAVPQLQEHVTLFGPNAGLVTPYPGLPQLQLFTSGPGPETIVIPDQLIPGDTWHVFGQISIPSALFNLYNVDRCFWVQRESDGKWLNIDPTTFFQGSTFAFGYLGIWQAESRPFGSVSGDQLGPPPFGPIFVNAVTNADGTNQGTPAIAMKNLSVRGPFSIPTP
jgi:hypothetical protein